jgi:hypothetical protein
MIFDVAKIYEGSDGDATRALYAHLLTMAPRGPIAMNLIRTAKASGRAKVYKGGERGRGSYRSMAYQKKDWSIGELCRALVAAPGVVTAWGWAYDPRTVNFEHVLYVDLPGAGQVSFHTSYRKDGPDYPGAWDGVRQAQKHRICSWAQSVVNGQELITEGENDGTHTGTEGNSEPPVAGGGVSGGAGEEQQEAFDL